MRGKDAEENKKLFVKVAEIIKKAGVSPGLFRIARRIC